MVKIKILQFATTISALLFFSGCLGTQEISAFKETLGVAVLFMSNIWVLLFLIFSIVVLPFMIDKILGLKKNAFKNDTLLSLRMVLFVFIGVALFCVDMRYQIYENKIADSTIEFDRVKNTYKDEDKIKEFLLLQKRYEFEKEKFLKIEKLTSEKE